MVGMYFSDREASPRPRVVEEFYETAWGGVVALVESSISTGAFGIDYPCTCWDSLGAVTGTDEHILALAVKAEIPALPWPLESHSTPPLLVVLDLIEFCFQHVAQPMQEYFHKDHRHLSFDRGGGQASFRDRVNQILARNGLAYELQANGQISRLGPPVLAEVLASSVFRTSDPGLDTLLESARSKFFSPDLQVRREALEKLWDAWERLKTALPPHDKKRSVPALLDRAAQNPELRSVLEKEARELTRIGNQFQIRHSEVSKIPIDLSAHVDYLFHRLFAMIYLLLRVLDGPPNSGC